MAGDCDAMEVDTPAEAAAPSAAAAPAPAAAAAPAPAAAAPAPADAAPAPAPVTPAGAAQDATCEDAVKACLEDPSGAGERIRNASWAEAPTDVADCVELAARQLLYDALDQEDDKKAKQIVAALVDHSTHCSTCGDRGPILNVAHKLLEDCIDAAPSTSADDWWALVEAHKDALTGDPVIFKAGKFILLRLCNSLLKRLSRTRQATLCGRILMFMAASWPLSEKSALNTKGLCHTANVTDFEDEEHFDEQNKEEDDDDRAPPKENYSTYKGFWSVQRWLANPPSCLKEPKPFLEAVDVTCSALERTACTQDELDRERAALLEKQHEPAPSGDESSQMLGSQKYLTNSRLLRIQLRDPQLRTQVASQLYMVLDYLRRELEASKRKDWASQPKARVRKIIAGTPPNGPESAGSLDLLLEHEVQWAAWKKQGCPSFEKAPLPKPVKQKRMYYAPPIPEVLQRRQKKKDDIEKKRLADEPTLEEKCRRLHCQIPTLEEHLKEWVEADDPDNDIDDEYHPRHDPVWKFRALRLVMKEKLPWFADMHDANVEVAVDKMFPDRKKRTDRPAPKPPPIAKLLKKKKKKKKPPPEVEAKKKRGRDDEEDEKEAKRGRRESPSKRRSASASPRSRREALSRKRDGSDEKRSRKEEHKPVPRGRGADAARGGRERGKQDEPARGRKDDKDEKWPRGRGVDDTKDAPRGRGAKTPPVFGAKGGFSGKADDAKAASSSRDRGAAKPDDKKDEKPARGGRERGAKDDKPRAKRDESRDEKKEASSSRDRRRDDSKPEKSGRSSPKEEPKPRGRGTAKDDKGAKADESRDEKKEASSSRRRSDDKAEARGRKADEPKKDESRDGKKEASSSRDRRRDEPKEESKPRGRGAKADDDDKKRNKKDDKPKEEARGRKTEDAAKDDRRSKKDESRERPKKDAKESSARAKKDDSPAEKPSRDRRRDAKDDAKDGAKDGAKEEKEKATSPRDRRRAKKDDEPKDEEKPRARGRGTDKEDKKRGRSPSPEAPARKRGRAGDDAPATRGRGGDAAPPARRGGRRDASGGGSKRGGRGRR